MASSWADWHAIFSHKKETEKSQRQRRVFKSGMKNTWTHTLLLWLFIVSVFCLSSLYSGIILLQLLLQYCYFMDPLFYVLCFYDITRRMRIPRKLLSSPPSSRVVPNSWILFRVASRVCRLCISDHASSCPTTLKSASWIEVEINDVTDERIQTWNLTSQSWRKTKKEKNDEAAKNRIINFVCLCAGMENVFSLVPSGLTGEEAAGREIH